MRVCKPFPRLEDIAININTGLAQVLLLALQRCPRATPPPASSRPQQPPQQPGRPPSGARASPSPSPAADPGAEMRLCADLLHLLR